MSERVRPPYAGYIPGSAADSPMPEIGLSADGSPAPDTGISPVNIVMPEGLKLDPERIAAMRKASGCIVTAVKTVFGIK